jgi:hypothetical protein
MNLVHNEKIKLTATWLNGLSIAIFAVGGFAPLLSGIYQSGPTVFVAFVSAVCLFVAGVLHVIGRRILEDLVP